jgi:hypothetical protein
MMNKEISDEDMVKFYIKKIYKNSVLLYVGIVR